MENKNESESKEIKAGLIVGGIEVGKIPEEEPKEHTPKSGKELLWKDGFSWSP